MNCALLHIGWFSPFDCFIQISYHSNNNVSATENFLGSGVIIVMNLIMWLRGLQNWLAGGMWKSLAVQARKALEYCRRNIMGHSGEILWNQNTNRNIDNRVLEGKEGCVIIKVRVIYATFWQSVWLCFICVLKIRSINFLKKSDWFV